MYIKKIFILSILGILVMSGCSTHMDERIGISDKPFNIKHRAHTGLSKFESSPLVVPKIQNLQMKQSRACIARGRSVEGFNIDKIKTALELSQAFTIVNNCYDPNTDYKISVSIVDYDYGFPVANLPALELAIIAPILGIFGVVEIVPAIMVGGSFPFFKSHMYLTKIEVEEKKSAKKSTFFIKIYDASLGNAAWLPFLPLMESFDDVMSSQIARGIIYGMHNKGLVGGYRDDKDI